MSEAAPATPAAPAAATAADFAQLHAQMDAQAAAIAALAEHLHFLLTGLAAGFIPASPEAQAAARGHLAE